MAAWCLYENLEVADLIGGHSPARARRCWIADHLGVTERTLDRARVQLLEVGPWLDRELRGRKRSALHQALGRPRETGEPYAMVPAWTLDRLDAGTDRPEGSVSPEVWRMYAVLCDRLDPHGHDLTIARLAEWLGCSVDTARRRFHELEAAGWVQARRSSGQWMHVRVVYREDLVGVEDPSQICRVTPRKSVDSPLADLSTPYETPSERSPSEEPTDLPAVGDLQHRRAATGGALTRGTDKTSIDEEGAAKVSGVDIARIYSSLPDQLRQIIPAHGVRRVRSAIRAQLAAGSRSVDELAARVSRRWVGGEWAGQRIDDPTAVAITLVRLGRPCGNVRCEDGADLDTGQKCRACSGSRQVWGPSGSGVVSAGEASSLLAPPPVRSVLDVQGASTGPNEEFLAERARMRGGRSSG